MKFQLEDVDIDGVHLVGSPANRRPFAVIKSLSAGPPASHKGASPVKTEELKKALEAGEITIGQFVELLGKDEVAKALEAGDLKIDQFVELLGKDVIAKALGVELPVAEPKIEKDKLSPEVKAYVEGLETKVDKANDAIDAIVTAREADEKAALEKRVEVLKTAGYEIDAEKATEAEVSAFEKAAAVMEARLQKMGILTMKGDPKDDDSDGSAVDLIRKEIARILGREPIDKAEEAKARRQVYRTNPGLLKAVTREERASA